MAHELDFRANGVGAMFSVRVTPWHREGVVLNDAPRTVEEALEAAGLNYDVELQPVYRQAGADDFVEIPDSRVVVRTDRGTPLGVVGKYYTPLQNRDALRVLEPLIDNGLAAFETAGALRGGRDIWALIRFAIDHPLVQEVFADEVVPFGVITNNHSGAKQVVIGETPIRIVCANTLGSARARWSQGLDRVTTIRHTTTVEAKLTAAAREMWSGIVERHAKLAEAYALLRRTYLDEAMFRKLVLDTAIPLPSEAPTTKRQETTLERLKERRAIVQRLWTEGAGHKGDGSAWEAYNGLVEAVDHFEDAFPIRGETRTQALLEGRLAMTKEAVFEKLVAHSLAVAA